MIELKPCPFCGGKAKMLNSYAYAEDYPVYWVECEDRLCCGSAQMAHKISFSEKIAAARWNKRKSNWISVKDRLPEEDTPELIFSVENKVYYGSFGYCKFYAIDNGGISFSFIQNEVTHWMPLPEPPEMEWKEND